MPRTCPSVEKVRFVSSGTEATMSALRVARGFTGRDKIVKFDGCYHGHADSLLVVGRLRRPRRSASRARPACPRGTAADTLVAPYNDLAAVAAVVAAHGAEIAAVIVEPVCGNMGCVAAARRATSRRCASSRARTATLLIFDEVMTGFRVALRRRAGALRRHARPDLPRQDHRRRPAGGGLRRPGRHHGHGRAARPGLPGRDAVGATRWPWPRARDARSARPARHLRAARGTGRATRSDGLARRPARPARR